MTYSSKYKLTKREMVIKLQKKDVFNKFRNQLDDENFLNSLLVIIWFFLCVK